MAYGELATEKSNEKSEGIDKMSVCEMLKLINNEDKTVAFAVEKALPEIAKAVELISGRLKNGGRLFYVGAGTSGRLGVLDASECPPTYGTPPELVQGVIAGGREAAFRAAEGAEDSREDMVAQMKTLGFCGGDVCVGISASGSAACVHGALEYARSLGAATVSVQCSRGGAAAGLSDVAIVAEVGPEVISGSTRMKAGTATKLILNMLSTCVMVKLGRVKGNRMIYMRPTNKKLEDRALRIIESQTGRGRAECAQALSLSGGDIEAAISILSKG